MGYDVAGRFAKVASELAYVSDYAVLPEHQGRQSFRVQGFRYPFRILPDVTVLLHNREAVDDGQTGRTTQEWREAILVEIEQGTPSFEDMKDRLSSYAQVLRNRQTSCRLWDSSIRRRRPQGCRYGGAVPDSPASGASYRSTYRNHDS